MLSGCIYDRLESLHARTLTWLCAICARRGRSATTSVGLEMASTYSACATRTLNNALRSSSEPLCSPPSSLSWQAPPGGYMREHATRATLVRLVMAAATSSGLVMSTKVVVTPHLAGKNDFSSAKVPPETERSDGQLLGSTRAHTHSSVAPNQHPVWAISKLAHRRRCWSTLCGRRCCTAAAARS